MPPKKSGFDVEARVVNRNGGRISLHVLFYIVKFWVGQCVRAASWVYGMKHALFYTTCSLVFHIYIEYIGRSTNLLYWILKLLILQVFPQLSDSTTSKRVNIMKETIEYACEAILGDLQHQQVSQPPQASSEVLGQTQCL